MRGTSRVSERKSIRNALKPKAAHTHSRTDARVLADNLKTARNDDDHRLCPRRRGRTDMSSSTRRRTTRASAAEDAKKTRDAADFAKKRAPTRGPFVLPGAKDDDDDDDGKKMKCSAWYCAMCDIDEAPEWMIFNRHIRTGYRVRTRWLGATRSIFMAHNETINIWSHLLGFLMFVALIGKTFMMAQSGVGLAAPPAHWVTGADLAKIERIQFATKWRREIRKDWDEIHAIDVALHTSVDKEPLDGSAHDVFKEVRAELLNVTHELAEHLKKGEEAFRAENRREVLRKNLAGAEGALDKMERKGGEDYRAISGFCYALRKKLVVLKKHIEFVPDDPEPAKPVTRWPMYLFLGGAVLCLFFSTLCHTYCCVGLEESERMWRLDYLGIAILIVASFYPMVHYSFYCLPGWRDMYLTGITTLGCLAVIPTFLRAFQKAEYAPLRASLFVALGLFGVFPIFQQVLFVWKIVPTPMMEAFAWEMAMAFGYISGAVLYAKAIPECWKPGAFDFFGCSHNIFHFLVVFSAYCHYRASVIYLTWRDNYTCDADHELLLDWYHLAAHFRYPQI